MYSAYKLNNQGDNIQPWCIPFVICNLSIVPCLVLTVASWLPHRFLRRQVRWSGIPISFRIFHSLWWSTVKGFDVVSKAEVDVFLEFSCFLYDPTDIRNLISCSSAFSKSSLNIWSFVVHVLLKLGLANAFEHYFTSIWNECNHVVEHSLALPFFGIGMKTDLFQSCGQDWSSQNLLAYWVQHFNSIIFWSNLKCTNFQMIFPKIVMFLLLTLTNFILLLFLKV